MVYELADKSVNTERLDHHGLVAASCKKLGLVEKINARIGSPDPRRVVQPGQSVKAMVMNGLGFTENRLYLTPRFFEDKAMGQFFPGLTPSDFDDHTLGKTLDEIAAYGSTRLFGEIAFEMAQEQNLFGACAHLDSTSFSLHGAYEKGSEEHVIEVTHGYSKDHRPDLKQVMLALVTSGTSNVPIWMEAQSGNTSDKESFHQVIAKVRSFQENLKQNQDFLWVADSALYSKTKLLASNAYLWVSRVPQTLQEAKNLLEQDESFFTWSTLNQDYRYSAQVSNLGGIKQRWLVIESKAAYEREKKTFERKLSKADEEVRKALWHLGNQIFACKKDAEKALRSLQTLSRFHTIQMNIRPVLKHASAGRPRKESLAQPSGFQVEGVAERNFQAIKSYLNRKGRFIIATNQLDTSKISDEMLFQSYKEQQGVERGFRFLKDPWFMVDSFFLKKESRIEALMMVMTLCLFVYNFSQFHLRREITQANESIPNQRNRPSKNPTLRWVFQMMRGITLVRYFDHESGKTREILTHMKPERIKVIQLFGPEACNIYGISKEIAGM